MSTLSKSSMQEKYTKAIDNLKIQFDHLYANLDDYQALYQLQIDIIDQVIDCEIEKKIAKEKGYDSEEFRFARFIFRSFGDAIAFAYVESHNLKQLSFNLEKGNLKQDAGSIGDKEGLKQELYELKSLIDKGIPCVLCDITNSIRHGDILVLCLDDPIVIECKTSPTKSNRVTRQKRTRRNLTDFYKRDEKRMKINDVSITVNRVNITSQYNSYVEEMNLLIEKAQESGASSILVENGLWYIVFHVGTVPPKITDNVQKLFVFCLNDYKDNEEWISYIPFVSSIQGYKNLLDFIEGKLIIVVAIDIDKIASENSLRFEEKEDNIEHPFWFYPVDNTSLDDRGMFAISTHYIQRVALEFLSLNSILVSAKNISLDSEVWKRLEIDGRQYP
jgi:hypothetical protein